MDTGTDTGTLRRQLWRQKQCKSWHQIGKLQNNLIQCFNAYGNTILVPRQAPKSLQTSYPQPPTQLQSIPQQTAK